MSIYFVDKPFVCRTCKIWNVPTFVSEKTKGYFLGFRFDYPSVRFFFYVCSCQVSRIYYTFKYSSFHSFCLLSTLQFCKYSYERISDVIMSESDTMVIVRSLGLYQYTFSRASQSVANSVDLPLNLVG